MLVALQTEMETAMVMETEMVGTETEMAMVEMVEVMDNENLFKNKQHQKICTWNTLKIRF